MAWWLRPLVSLLERSDLIPSTHIVWLITCNCHLQGSDVLCGLQALMYHTGIHKGENQPSHWYLFMSCCNSSSQACLGSSTSLTCFWLPLSCHAFHAKVEQQPYSFWFSIFGGVFFYVLFVLVELFGLLVRLWEKTSVILIAWSLCYIYWEHQKNES